MRGLIASAIAGHHTSLSLGRHTCLEAGNDLLIDGNVTAQNLSPLSVACAYDDWHRHGHLVTQNPHRLLLIGLSRIRRCCAGPPGLRKHAPPKSDSLVEKRGRKI